MAGLLVWGAYPFLAVNDGGSGEVMVIEGWIGGRRVDGAATAFHSGKYQTVVVVRDVYQGGDKWSSGSYTADYLSADLVRLGVPKERVLTLLCPVVRKDRTYHCALAVREWLRKAGQCVTALDVVTLAPHARRSRLLYEKAFGDGVAVGVVGIEDPSFDAGRWWRSSAGVREVLGEGLAYLYARLFFWPDPHEDSPGPPVPQEPTSGGSAWRESRHLDSYRRGPVGDDVSRLCQEPARPFKAGRRETVRWCLESQEWGRAVLAETEDRRDPRNTPTTRKA
ncbi:MAG: YdcF family protein [Verrucomicrobia bacterium]|nr:YdcF family protein [Verrucomicrobiota bacterium]